MRLYRSARSDRNRFVALYVVLVVGLLVAAAAFVYEAHVIIQDGVSEDRAFSVLSTTNRALDDFQDAETGQRGYLLTGSAAYLEPYVRGTRDIAQAMQQLNDAVAGDPESMEIVHRIDVARRNKLAELARTIDVARSSGWRESVALVQTDVGRREMESLRAELDRLSQVWQARRHTAAADARERVMFGGGALAVLAIFIGALLAYALVVQQRAFANIHAYSQAMDREAGCDPLTGLPNRRRLLAAIDALAARPGVEGEKVALFYLDIDGFKSVNDALGHGAGDVSVSQAEYAGRFQIGLSIGIATYPDRVKNVRQLVDVADAAMYVAKRERSRFRFGPVTANDSAYGVSVAK